MSVIFLPITRLNYNTNHFRHTFKKLNHCVNRLGKRGKA